MIIYLCIDEIRALSSRLNVNRNHVRFIQSNSTQYVSKIYFNTNVFFSVLGFEFFEYE